MTVKVQTHPNARIRTFHSDVPYTEEMIAAAEAVDGVEPPLYRVPKRYEADFMIGLAFEWADVEPRIIAAIQAASGEPGATC